MGMIYKRGAVFWVKYYRQGKAYRETTKSKNESDAKRLLKKREGEIAHGKIPGIVFEKVRFNELVDDFLADYRVNQKKSLVRAERSIKHLKEAFEGMRVVNISTPLINHYIETRIDEGAANGTINRELAALKRLLNLGARQTPPKVDRVPFIPMLKENNVRQGFFEHGDFLALKKNLPEFLKPFTLFAYKTGWRFSEIANLKWNQIDFAQHTARLESGETKNNEGRTVYLDNELQDILIGLWESRKGREKISPYVFLNESVK
jgi:integrase